MSVYPLTLGDIHVCVGIPFTRGRHICRLTSKRVERQSLWMWKMYTALLSYNIYKHNSAKCYIRQDEVKSLQNTTNELKIRINLQNTKLASACRTTAHARPATFHRVACAGVATSCCLSFNRNSLVINFVVKSRWAFHTLSFPGFPVSPFPFSPFSAPPLAPHYHYCCYLW